MQNIKSKELVTNFEDIVTRHCSDLNEIKETLRSMYNALKMDYKTLGDKEYLELIRRVKYREEVLSNYSITDAKTNIQLDSINKEAIETLKQDNLTISGILNYIMMQCRYFIKNNYLKYTYAPYSVRTYDDIDVTNMCFDVSSEITKLCRDLPVNCHIHRLNVGFVKTDDIHLINNKSFHWFCIVKIGEYKYLIDLTYKQFFTLYKNEPSRLGGSRT